MFTRSEKVNNVKLVKIITPERLQYTYCFTELSQNTPQSYGKEQV